ncbi:class I SAM-dependent methyltransferase [Methylomonas methanica]|uniref:Methyltransferase type 12 n=1 Tax=Methylomonas methanica (strain DSM 25384 / MC09) TaxID=857087 RepID=F9ZWC7_METMM|nr:class I SAM-dependent methyltransferase [Methylomonas methanica]AEF99596.1 Methyltransferase type 12 [Methylomonas methanica MC09]
MRDILKGLKLFDIDLYKLRSRHFHADMIRDRELVFADFASCLRDEHDFVCPLCGDRNHREYLAWREYTLFECTQCGAVSPNVDSTKVAALNLHSSSIVEDDVKREILATYEYRKQTFAAERLVYLRELIPGFGENSDSVLDIGCGPGYFLSYLKDKGISGRGLEVNPFCVRFCQESGLNTVDGRLEDEPDECYSLITMFDVLEHLDQPINFFQAAYRKLRHGGYLLAYTPNLHSISTYLMGGEHNMLAVFNHLCFYDQNSLDFLAKHSGFEVQRCDYFGLDVMDYLAMKECDDNYSYFEKLRPMVAPLQALVDAHCLGNSMRVLFRKA